MAEGKPVNGDRARVIAPPPLILLLGLVAGILVHLRWQRRRLLPGAWLGRAAGWPVIAVSALMGGWAVRTMRRGGEHPDPAEPTNSLVTTGPFAFSRNPIYVAGTLLYVGIALVVNTIWSVIFLPVVLTVIHYGVILREERYLERLFGAEYQRYRGQVRRYL